MSSSDPDLDGLITRYLDRQRKVLREADLRLRRRDHAVVHRARIAIRRYRSALRVFGDAFDEARCAHLEGELAWYGSALGAVRDVQVLRERLARLRTEVADENVLGPVDARIAALLHRDEQRARKALSRAMKSARYVSLLSELDEWQRTPPLRAHEVGDVRGYLRSAERRAAKRLDRARQRDLDAALSHRARKAAKRARYAGELAEPALGKAARRVIKRSKRVQRSLGELQDGAVLVEFLRRAAAQASGEPEENGFTFGYLAAIEERAAHGKPAPR